jgi:hypothetical protein
MQPEELRKVRRLCSRLRDEVGEDARIMGSRNWWARKMDESSEGSQDFMSCSAHDTDNFIYSTYF